MRARTLAIAGLVCITGATSIGIAPVEAEIRNRQKENVIELGRRLFMDPTVSRGGKFSCAACHDPEHGFSDPRVHSEDENGLTARHSQPLLDLTGEGFHWDGEFKEVRQILVARLGTAQQALDQSRDLVNAHFANSVDVFGAANVNAEAHRRRIQTLAPPYYGPVTPRGPVITPTEITARLDQDDRYSAGFYLAFGNKTVTTDRMIDAMGAYMASLTATEGDYDRYRAGRTGALNENELRGLTLFEGKAGCNSCHLTKGKNGRILTDGKFHNTGVAFRIHSHQFNPGPKAVGRPASNVGRAAASFVPKETGAFKTPSLRDVALRPPYMHDGSFATLREVVDYYATGGTENPGLDPHVSAVDLDEQERDDLVAFLESLTGDTRPGLGQLPNYRRETTRVRIMSLAGQPVEGLTVRVVPTGDRLDGTDAMPKGVEVVSEKWGWIEFPFPASTHVRLEADDYEIGLDRMIPDSLRKTTVLATPNDMVSVRVIRSDNTTKLPPSLELRPRSTNGRVTYDAAVYLTRVQTRGRGEAVYAAHRVDVVAAVPSIMREEDLVAMTLTLPGNISGTFEIDLRGGQSDPIDLRPARRNRGTGGAPTAKDRRKRRDTGGGLKGKVPRDTGPGRKDPSDETTSPGGGGAAGDR